MKFDFNTLEFVETSVLPNKLAFACADKTLTWDELRIQTTKLAQLISEYNVEKTPVIIYGAKEALFPTAMLACICSGVPYVAIDKIIPQDRISFIVEATGSNLVVNCSDNNMQFNVATVISADWSIEKKDIQKQKNTAIESGLCYILFTSGSTGAPKGVKISLQSVRSFVAWMCETFPVSSSSVFINQATFSFDISLVEFLGTLALGGSAILNAAEVTKAAPLTFIDRIENFKGNFWNSTPSFIYQYLMHPDFNGSRLPFLRTFLFMGEELPARIVERIFTAFPEAKVYNAYGPTEATVVTTFIEITKEVVQQYPKSLPIGYPKADGKILIANETGDVLQSGEIIIVGNHVSHGYLNNPSLSAEKFFLHEGKRAYKTGDLGYYKDEMVFYEGRIDDQIKYNGYRIELDEINSSLHRVDGVLEAVTIPLKVGNTVKKIISFLKVHSEKEHDAQQFKSEIKANLLRSIPEYMVPSELCFIDEFPVNTNHKVDRKVLAEMYSKGLWR